MNDVPEIASKSHLGKMVNNRDYSVLINYNPPTRCLTLEHSNQTFLHDLRLLEIRTVLLSCIYYSAHMVKQMGAQNIKSISSEVNGFNHDEESLKLEYLDLLDLNLGNLKYLYTQLESDPPTSVPINVFGSFFGSKLFGLEKSKIMLTIIINFIELIKTMGSNVKNSACMDEWTNKMKINATDLSNGFEKAIDFCQCIVSKTIDVNDPSLKLEGRKEVLEILTNMIEVSSITIYYL